MGSNARTHDLILLPSHQQIKKNDIMSNRVYDNILQTIGNTPLVRLNRVVADLPCKVYAKVETFNPGNSIKDRMALKMLETAEKEGFNSRSGTN